MEKEKEKEKEVNKKQIHSQKVQNLWSFKLIRSISL
jgi:hypothetical protein